MLLCIALTSNVYRVPHCIHHPPGLYHDTAPSHAVYICPAYASAFLRLFHTKFRHPVYTTCIHPIYIIHHMYTPCIQDCPPAALAHPLYSTLRPGIQHCDDPHASTLHTPASHSVSSSPVYHPPRVKTNHPSHLYEPASQHPPTERVLYKGWKSAV